MMMAYTFRIAHRVGVPVLYFMSPSLIQITVAAFFVSQHTSARVQL